MSSFCVRPILVYSNFYWYETLRYEIYCSSWCQWKLTVIYDNCDEENQLYVFLLTTIEMVNIRKFKVKLNVLLIMITFVNSRHRLFLLNELFCTDIKYYSSWWINRRAAKSRKYGLFLLRTIVLPFSSLTRVGILCWNEVLGSSY